VRSLRDRTDGGGSGAGLVTGAVGPAGSGLGLAGWGGCFAREANGREGRDMCGLHECKYRWDIVGVVVAAFSLIAEFFGDLFFNVGRNLWTSF
jgi:hypothetical protein